MAKEDGLGQFGAWVGSVIIFGAALNGIKSCGKESKTTVATPSQNTPSHVAPPPQVAPPSQAVPHSSASANSTSPSFHYCRAIVAAEQKYPIVGQTDFGQAAEMCDRLFFEIQSIDSSGVDRRIIDWARRYSEVLMGLKIVFTRCNARFSSEYQSRIMIQAFMRGYEGETFGPALEEFQRQDQDAIAYQSLVNRRLLLLAEMARLYNEIAPPGHRMILNK